MCDILFQHDTWFIDIEDREQDGVNRRITVATSADMLVKFATSVQRYVNL